MWPEVRNAPCSVELNSSNVVIRCIENIIDKEVIRFHDIDEKEDVAVLEAIDSGYSIVLYNDDVNTFDHVINCLVKYCKHSSEQAEQCSLIVHYKGKCVVKHGSEIKLKPICDALCKKGLSALIEEV